jgi:polyisoprenoid-binding protein YceI
MTHTGWAAVVLLSLACFGCDADPGKGKEKASVGSAKPVGSAVEAATFGAWKIEDSSTIAFTGSNVTTKHEGGFKTFTGGITLADGKVEGATVVIEIDMGSVFTDDGELTTHLKSADFFDVPNHKTAGFRSTRVVAGEGGSYKVTGNLTVRGEMHSITFPAKIDAGGDKITVSADFAINRKDFNINYKGAADDLIRDNVAIKLALTASKR